MFMRAWPGCAAGQRCAGLAQRLAAQRLVVRGFGVVGFDAAGSVRCAAAVRRSTWALVRRSMKGAIRRRSRCCASRSRSRSIGRGEALVEARQGAEQAGVAEAHDRPQFGQAVFDRRAGEREAEVRVQLEHRLRALGGGVLDGLGLVGDHGVPVRPAKRSAPAAAGV